MGSAGYALIFCCVLGVAGCSREPPPTVWMRSSGQTASGPDLDLALAQCKQAGYQAVAQLGPRPMPPQRQSRPLFQPDMEFCPDLNSRIAGCGRPRLDSSAIADLGDSYQEGAAYRQRLELEQNVLNSTVYGCMARAGYLARPR